MAVKILKIPFFWKKKKNQGFNCSLEFNGIHKNTHA